MCVWVCIFYLHTCVCVRACVFVCVCVCVCVCVRACWPLQDIAITTIVWCTAYKEGSVGERMLRNGRAM